MTLAEPFWLILLIPLGDAALAVAAAVAAAAAAAGGGADGRAPGHVRAERGPAGALGHGRAGGRPQPLHARRQRGAWKRRRPTCSTRPCPPTTSWPWSRSPRRRRSSSRRRRPSSPASRPRWATTPRAWPTPWTWPCRWSAAGESGRILRAVRRPMDGPGRFGRGGPRRGGRRGHRLPGHRALRGRRPGHRADPGPGVGPARRIVHDHRLDRFAAGADRSPTSLLRGAQTIARGHDGRAHRHQPAGLPRHGRPQRRVRVRACTWRARGPIPCRATTARGCWWASAARGRCCASSPARPSALPGLLAKGGVNVAVASRPPSATGRSKNWPATRPCCWRTRRPAGSATSACRTSPPGSTHSGGGLMLTGGRDSLRLRRILQEPAGARSCPSRWSCGASIASCRLAIVVALDRSGSMAMPCADGRPKIELADLATAEVLNMLGPTDQFGCIAVDTAAARDRAAFGRRPTRTAKRRTDPADRLRGRRDLHLRGAGGRRAR